MDLNTLIEQVTRPAHRAAVPHDLLTPQAITLVVTLVKCENCGHITRSLNPHILIRYGGRANYSQSVKHTRDELAQFTHLPRERRVFKATAPFCEECF